MGYTATSSGLIIPASAKSSSASAPVVAKIGSLSIWARNGYVCMSKELPNGEEEFDQTDVNTAKLRLEAIAEDTKAMQRSERPDYGRIRVNKQFMEAYAQVIQMAKEQGPFEYADMRRDRVRRRPVSVSVPGINSQEKK